MNLKNYFLGRFSHHYWKKNVSFLLIAEFLGTLLLAWALRPVWADESWVYTPFKLHISRLGKGRLEGNIGAWVFLIGFCLFPVVGTGWNSYVRRRLAPVSNIFSWILWVVVEFGMICVACVGIFDGSWPNEAISGKMHSFGATYAFLGHTIAAALILIIMSIIYHRAPEENRSMACPWKFSLAVIELVGMSLVFRIVGGPELQWLLMLSLMGFIIAMSLFFPEKFPK